MQQRLQGTHSSHTPLFEKSTGQVLPLQRGRYVIEDRVGLNAAQRDYGCRDHHVGTPRMLPIAFAALLRGSRISESA